MHKNIGYEPITPNQLRYFVQRNNIDVKTFAAQIGYSAQTVAGWMEGRGVMSRKAMEKVIAWGVPVCAKL